MVEAMKTRGSRNRSASSRGRGAGDARVVLVTAPSLRVARALARVVLDARLAACVNLVPGLESHYVWEGKRERSAEVLVMLKTFAGELVALEALIRAHHPYEVPQFVVLPVTAVSSAYLGWMKDSVGPAN